MNNLRITVIPAAALLVLLLAACGKGGSSAPSPTASSPTRTPTPTTISALVLLAAPGDTIRVPAGVYHEQVDIQRSITLQAAGDGPVIIDGECQRANGISIPTGSSITITGIEIRNTVGAGVLVGNAPEDLPRPHNVTLNALTITDFNCRDEETQALAGIAAWYTGCCMTIVNNTITYRSSGSQQGYGNGIWIKSTSDSPNRGGHMVANNTITGGWDGIGGETETDPHGSFDRDSMIQNNHIIDCWDDGIQVEGGDQNVRVLSNEIEGCGSGIAFAAPTTGPLYVERNNIHDLSEGFLENLYCFKVGRDGGGITYLTDNVCRTTGDGLFQANEGLSPIISSGNCYQVSGYAFWLGGPFDGSSFDGDYISSSNPEGWAKWIDTVYDGIDAFRADTGFERNGAITTDCPSQP